MIKFVRTISLVTLVVLLSAVDSSGQDLLITEFMARRSAPIVDDDERPSDFIEVYNAGTASVDLGGYFLSDDCGSPFKWTFPAGVVIGPEEFVVVWASERDRSDPCCPLHANFRLGVEGECVVLSDPLGDLLHAYQFYPAQAVGYSYGLAMSGSPDGLERDVRHYFPTPTPGFANVTGAPGVSPPPVFSEPSGAYPPGLAIDLSLENPVEGTEIRFTTSESIPTETSPVYSEPINVLSELIITARAFQPGLLPSEPVSGYYVVLAQDVVDFSSTIPLVICSTLGRTIPNRCGQGGYTPGRFLVFRPEGGRARLADEAYFSHEVGYRKRGNPQFSCGRQKFFFNVEFRDWQEKDEDVAFFDFTPHSDFVMWGPFEFDRSFMRNPIAFWLSRELGRWSPRTEFVETFLHTGSGRVTMESYWGVYVLMERNERGGGRIEIERISRTDNDEPEIAGGYILKRDRIESGDTSTAAGIYTNLVYTYPKVPSVAQQDHVRDYLARMLTHLNPQIGSQEDSDLIDVGSWIDHHILSWFPKNVDAFRVSGHFFKSRSGLLEMGPLWDYDRSMGCAVDPRPVTPHGFHNDQAWDGGSRYFEHPGPPGDGLLLGSWYGLLFDDEPPTGGSPWAQAYRARWQELREGPFRTSNILARIDGWAAVLDEPARRNFARWPQVNPRFGGYMGEVNHLKDWLESRAEWIDEQFFVPEFNHPGGGVEPGFELEITVDGGQQIFYTLDGTDPRGTDGQVSASAMVYDGPIPITENIQVRARARIGATWSGMIEEYFLTNVVSLVVTEIMYRPAALPGDTFDSSVYQFLEFHNQGDQSIDLQGVVLDRPRFAFGNGSITTVGPGGYFVVARNVNAFIERYGEGILVAGAFFGGLRNTEQDIVVTGPIDEPVMDFQYRSSWYPSTDGGGYSLVIRSPTAHPDTWSSGGSWRASRELGGSPGRDDSGVVQGLRRQGDLNSSGSLEISDAILLVLNLFGEREQPCTSGEGNLGIMDVDGDGILTQTDAFRLLNYLFLDGSPPEKGLECSPIPGCLHSCN